MALTNTSIFDNMPWALAFGNWLDEFYRQDRESQIALISSDIHNLSLSREHKAYLAAAVHHLANAYKLPVPEWVWKECYFLSSPYFAEGVTGNLRLVYLYEAPLEFKVRMVFTSRNALHRV